MVCQQRGVGLYSLSTFACDLQECHCHVFSSSQGILAVGKI